MTDFLLKFTCFPPARLESVQLPLVRKDNTDPGLFGHQPFQLCNQAAALGINFILSVKNPAAQLVALFFRFALALLPVQLFFQRTASGSGMASGSGLPPFIPTRFPQ
jgi:hypothetical protein